jgi:hypothetical protein
LVTVFRCIAETIARMLRLNPERQPRTIGTDVANKKSNRALRLTR